MKKGKRKNGWKFWAHPAKHPGLSEEESFMRLVEPDATPEEMEEAYEENVRRMHQVFSLSAEETASSRRAQQRGDAERRSDAELSQREKLKEELEAIKREQTQLLNEKELMEWRTEIGQAQQRKVFIEQRLQQLREAVQEKSEKITALDRLIAHQDAYDISVGIKDPLKALLRFKRNLKEYERDVERYQKIIEELNRNGHPAGLYLERLAHAKKLVETTKARIEHLKKISATSGLEGYEMLGHYQKNEAGELVLLEDAEEGANKKEQLMSDLVQSRIRQKEADRRWIITATIVLLLAIGMLIAGIVLLSMAPMAPAVINHVTGAVITAAQPTGPFFTAGFLLIEFGAMGVLFGLFSVGINIANKVEHTAEYKEAMVELTGQEPDSTVTTHFEHTEEYREKAQVRAHRELDDEALERQDPGLSSKYPKSSSTNLGLGFRSGGGDEL